VAGEGSGRLAGHSTTSTSTRHPSPITTKGERRRARTKGASTSILMMVAHWRSSLALSALSCPRTLVGQCLASVRNLACHSRPLDSPSSAIEPTGCSDCPRIVRTREPAPSSRARMDGPRGAGSKGSYWSRVGAVTDRIRLSIQRSRVQFPSSPPINHEVRRGRCAAAPFNLP
jgi:hypothetical protein